MNIDKTNNEEWKDYCFSQLDKEGYIPYDWTIHLNGDIEHQDGDNYQKRVVISFEDWLNLIKNK